MEYNSSKSKLIIPEYGRNIQMLIEHAKTLEEADYRQAFVEKIVNLIYSMHPQTRNVEDYRAKIWSHILRIANYELEVEVPENVTYEEEVRKRPKMLKYPDGDVRLRHYGRNVQAMIQKAIDMEEEDKKLDFMLVIAAYMKMAYKTWNRATVSDETIKKDLEKLSKGALVIDENVSLDNVYTNNRRRNNNKRSNQSKDNYRSNQNRGRNNKNNNYGKRRNKH